MPPFSKILRASRWIALSVLIGVGVWIIWKSQRGPVKTSYALRQEAVTEYKQGDYWASFSKYQSATSRADTTDSLAITIREMATNIGLIGDSLSTGRSAKAYQRYIELQRDAYSVAKQVGADSVAQEASESLANMLRYCERKNLDCLGTMSNRETAARGPSYELPVTFLLVCLAAIAVVLLLYPKPKVKNG